MIIGYTPFEPEFFDSIYCSNEMKKIEVKNVILDELKVDEKNIEPTKEKQDWDYYTLLLAKFNGTLEGGDIDNKGIPIKFLKLKRRKKGELNWDTIAEFEFDKDISQYDYIDKYVKDGETYEYSLVPVTANIEGVSSISECKCKYDELFITDAYTTYRMRYNVKSDSIKSNIQQSFIQTFGKYPISFTGDVNYKSGSFSCLLLSKESMDDDECCVLDDSVNMKYRDNAIAFFNNGKPKLLKDGDGNFLIVKTSCETEDKFEVQNRGLYTVKIDWTEIDDASVYDNFAKNEL